MRHISYRGHPVYPPFIVMTHADLIARREGADLEMKSAQGRHGRGALPDSIWETYSAMANTDGGEILLGIREAPGVAPAVLGVAEPDPVRRALWDGLNNRQVVSANVLRNSDVDILTEGDHHVIRISVPRASRRQRPIFTGQNPFGGTYRRDHEGDYRCTDAEVRRMIADAEHDTLDARIFPHYGLGDLDLSSFASFRNEFRSANPDHVWLTYDDRELLEQLGGWRRDRSAGEEGLTLAGLLMFGRLRAILDNVPHYVLDYRETAPDADRWADRVTTDGTWPGNLYGFYRRAYARLVTNLRVPFRTEAGRRIDETPVHRALKEALVNALIHADYSGTTPILVNKGRDGFSFRNPGTLRLPPETIRAGGTSDCRNRNLQKMFQMIGSAEQAGSGFPTILGAWREQHWRAPSLVEDAEAVHVSLGLSTASLLPEATLHRLTDQYGSRFTELGEAESTAVVTAAIEGRVSNPRLQELLDLHPTEITNLLGGLVANGLFASHGGGRWTYYTLVAPPDGAQLDLLRNTQDTGADTPDDAVHTADNEANSLDSDADTPGRESIRALLANVPEAGRLLDLVKSIGLGKRAQPTVVRSALGRILAWARDEDVYLSSAQLAALLGRSTGTTLVYLKELIEDGQVETLHAGRRAPSQAYRAVRS